MNSLKNPNQKEFLLLKFKTKSRYLKFLSYIEYLLERYLFGKKYTTRHILGFNFVLDLENEGISGTLAINGIREIDHTTILIQELEEGMVCLDIGSNIGYYPLIMASIVGESGKVYAFEPDPRNFKILEMNIRTNCFDTIIKPYPIAVGLEPGQLEMLMMNKTNLNTLVNDGSIISEVHDLTEKRIVDVTSIDEIYQKCEKNIDFIRMDIEGFEVEVFRGGLNFFKEIKNCKILLELHPIAYNETRNFAAVLQEIFKLGFFPKLVVSSGNRPSSLFQERGYTSNEHYKEGKFNRYVYRDILKNDCIEFCTYVPKICRYLLLEKKIIGD